MADVVVDVPDVNATVLGLIASVAAR